MKRLIDLMPGLIREHPLLSFMLVGGIGYVINMGIYYPLTMLFGKDTVIFGQHFYVPPFLISSYIAITSNYLMNRRWTFQAEAKAHGYFRYLGTYFVSLIFEIAALVVLSDYVHLAPQLSAAIAILGIFLGRYALVKRFVWKTAPGEPERQKGKM